MLLLLPFLRVEDGRYWRYMYANPSIQASNQIPDRESPLSRQKRREVCMQVNSLRHVSSANGLFLEEEKEEKAEEE